MIETVQIHFGKESLTSQLNKLAESYDGNTPLHVKIGAFVKKEDLEQLKAFIEKRNPLPFTQLTLQTDYETLNNPSFLELLKQLNNTSISKVKLLFTLEEVEKRTHNEINKTMEKIASEGEISYPLQYRFLNLKDFKQLSEMDMHSSYFEHTVIENIHKKNNQQKETAVADLGAEETKPASTASASKGPKIKLKELIKKQTVKEVHIPLEIQHVEQMEQEQQQQQEEVVELQHNVEDQTIQQYDGQLLGYQDLSAPMYKQKVLDRVRYSSRVNSLYALLKQELFANLPHAIKYVSPEAAERLVSNLPQLVSINKDNLPSGFLLKQTKEGELVLDYDSFLDKEYITPFTPVESDIDTEALYGRDFEDQSVEEWIKDLEPFYPDMGMRHIYSYPPQLSNLSVRHGHEGVVSFFKNFKAVTDGKPEVANFLLQHYLMQLPQWDHLHNNQAFFSSIRQISRFDEHKWRCFQTFLKDTGSSQHDLIKTVAAFEEFWHELNTLCKQQNVAIERINCDPSWTTPKGGNPVVYMERMLSILKNARSLDDQFKLLPGISLSNYGAYYASRYEGFKAVSTAMELNYDADQLNARSFNKNFNLYRVELNELLDHVVRQKYWALAKAAEAPESADNFWLVDCSKPLPQPFNLERLKKENLLKPFTHKEFKPPYQFYRSAENGAMELLYTEFPRRPKDLMYYRFIGLQEKGITVSSFQEQFISYYSAFLWGGQKRDWLLDSRLSNILQATMPLITHQRYVETEPLKRLFTTIEEAPRIGYDVFDKVLNLLYKFYSLDIKLNQVEGLILFQSMSDMNSCEFESEFEDTFEISRDKVKKESVEKLLIQLEQNKFATLKLFRTIGWRRPFLFALDTAEFLAKDPLIASSYRDDLLDFSALINGAWDMRENAYFHLRFATPDQRESEVGKKVLGDLNKVQHFLHQAAAQKMPNNLYYAIREIINAKKRFSSNQFIDACTEIEALRTFDNTQVNKILEAHQFEMSVGSFKIFTKDDDDLKDTMVSAILKIESYIDKKTENSERQNELKRLSIADLQTEFEKVWAKGGVGLSVVGTPILNDILTSTVQLKIKSAFRMDETQGLLRAVGERIGNLPDFQGYSDFEKVNHIANEAGSLAFLFRVIAKNPHVAEQEQEFIRLFSSVDYARVDYKTLYALLNLLEAMPRRNYLPLLSTILGDGRFICDQVNALKLINHLATLNRSYLPTEYLTAFSKLAIANIDQNLQEIVTQLRLIYERDNKDPILELIMSQSDIIYKQIELIFTVSAGIENNRERVSAFLAHLISTKKLESTLNGLIICSEDKRKKVLEILSNGYALNRQDKTQETKVDYKALTDILIKLTEKDLTDLHKFYETTPVSAVSLYHAFQNPEKPKVFQKFLSEFEKAPFGPRDLKKQFSVSSVERVINQTKDLLNDSVYTYQYRKQLMEAFLFVNAIGENVPVYYNKAAKDLTNKEIRDFFAALKAKEIKGLTPFQSRLLALGLMREAMFRSTGEFPYSTQVIALIDCMMHPGDFLSNIDTGQGKSQIDTMKAALLWLDSDRVDLTTSSLVDARRDIANYGPFLKLLNIPHSETPVSSASSKEVFKKDGINFSTFAQLSLFSAKAKATGEPLDTPETVVSAVINESDYTILDDRTIYRFATTDNKTIGAQQVWIYSAINDFVSRPGFIASVDTSASDDVHALKVYLKNKAKELKTSGKVVDKFTDAQYVSWIESALTVNYVLKENKDYVIPEELEKKIINGKEVLSKVVKILMKDQKVSPDSVFGNGIQQLLYARLNKERGREDFVIEPQTKTIISTNNKNLIDYYRAHKGFIWGSSGTVGSRVEIEEQYRKYGFDFAKAEPHQENRVKFNKPIIEADEKKQFSTLISQITGVASPFTQYKGKPWDPKTAPPNVVFCKDIETAKRLFKELEKSNPRKFPLQLYTGLGKEEEFISKAGQPGMITITTSALGRNTDIPYDRLVGLRVWNLSVDLSRSAGQKQGRTGRQGSEGVVNHILNAQDLGGKTIEQVRKELDQKAALERSVNEELYNVLGYLLLQIDGMPEGQFEGGKAKFLRGTWSQFSAETERQFREHRLAAGYNKDAFIETVLTDFNSMVSGAVKTPVAPLTLAALKKTIETPHVEKAKYNPYKDKVKMADCTPPIDIAYHLVGLTAGEVQDPDLVKKKIKMGLKQLVTHIKKDNAVAVHSNYLRYLNANPATQALIVEAHKEFMTQLLKDNSKKLNFLQRWLGFTGKMTQVASNQNYLLVSYALGSVSNKPVVELEAIRNAVNTLLDEYLETSWFISSSRKQWAQDLKTRIDKAENIDEVIKQLSEAQIATARKDIAENKTRNFKSLHSTGRSRYQTVLSRALNLTSSLSGKTETDSVSSELIQQLTKVTDGTPIADLTVDELKHKAKSGKKDKNNASVIIESLENAVGRKSRKGPEGMVGRVGLFGSSSKEEGPKSDGPTETDTNKP